MKKLAILLTIALLIGLFAGCQAAKQPETYVECPAKLGSNAAKPIEEALQKKRGGTVNWWTKDNVHGTARYYGSDNGYDIIFDIGGEGIAMAVCINIDGALFKHGMGFGLYAHKEGQLLDLKTAYESGLVSKDAVTAAAQLHLECQKLSYPNLADSYWTTEDSPY